MNIPLNSQPLYQQIYDDIEKKISTGQIAYMEQLPVLPDLCRQYGVSEAPIRRALDELSRAGLISKQRGRGKGTFAIKRLHTRTMRVLMMDELDIYRSPIELVHEIFDIIAGIRDAARTLGAEAPLISPTSHDTLSLASGDTGYIIIAQSIDGYKRGIAVAEGQGAKCVLVNPPSAIEPCVRVDINEASYLGVNYIAQLGHKRIAYVGSSDGQWFSERFAGYRRALDKNGLPFDSCLVQDSGGVQAEDDERALDALMALSEPPTAIFAASDYRALHILTHARRKGIVIPQQLSLCGYDNISEVAGVEPPLTTVHHPRYELGREAVALLSSLLMGEKTATLDVLVPPHVEVRASCGSPRR